jgi:inhibitor of growth protein 3
MHDQVDRYLRRLDQELFKFKMELEADHRGITEVLEKSKLNIFIFLPRRHASLLG